MAIQTKEREVEELQMLLEMVGKLPQMALWVLIGIFAYKVAIVGSIFGVLRLLILKGHDYLTKRKTIPPEVKTVEVRPMLDGMAVTGTLESLIGQIHRLRGVRTGIGSNYLHRCSVEFLKDALDAQFAKEAEAEAKRIKEAAEASARIADLMRNNVTR